MKKRSFLKSVNNAAAGVIHVVRHERNMRLHFLIALLILLLAIFFGVKRVEWLILCGAVSLVLIAEMINTAIEYTVDLVHKTYNPEVKIVKDVSAGMVLLSALYALIVGFSIFLRYWTWPTEVLAMKVRHASPYLTFVSLLVVVFLVVGAKAILHKGSPFRGGPVSGHSAVAFSLWTTLFFTQQNNFVIGSTFLLAALVAQSRLRAKIHSFWEVVAGGMIGALITTLFFQIFR